MIPPTRTNNLMTQLNQPCMMNKGASKYELTLKIEIPEENFTIFLHLPRLVQTIQTSGWLLQRVKTLIMGVSKAKSISPHRLLSWIGLRTKNADLHIDYLLSLSEQPLNFLKDQIVLLPVITQGAPFLDAMRPKLTLDDFKIIAKISEGGFSKVYLVQMKADNHFYALKQICKFQANGEPIDSNLLEEGNILSSLKGNQFIKLHFTFQTQLFCYFVLDFVPGGNLASLLRKFRKFEEDEAKFFVVQLLLAFEELHNKNIVYRDLKLDNLLIDLEGYIKLCDFGLSTVVDENQPLIHRFCGTPHFVSPEMLKREGYDKRTDYFSLGVVLFEMVTGYLPFNHPNRERLFQKIMYQEPKYPSDLPTHLQDFISGLLCKIPAERLGAKRGVEEILAHPWLRDFDLQKIRERKVKISLAVRPITRLLHPYSGKTDIEAFYFKHRPYVKITNSSFMLQYFSFQSAAPLRPAREKARLTRSTCCEEEELNIDADEQAETDYTEYFDENCAVKHVIEDRFAKYRHPHPSKSGNESYSEIFYDFEGICL